jgi:hypothetical protein
LLQELTQGCSKLGQLMQQVGGKHRDSRAEGTCSRW